MKPRAGRGFGLIESMLSLALFAVLLAVIADLVVGYQNMVRQGQSKDRELRAARLGFERIRSDIRAAAQIVSASGSLLELQRLPSELSPRLPATVPETPPSTWNILNPGDLTTIKYHKVGDKLVRQAGGVDSVLVDRIEDFQVDDTLGPHRFQITLKLSERKREVTLVTRITRL